MACSCHVREKIVHLVKQRRYWGTPLLSNSKFNFSSNVNQSEYSETPKYPKILDLSRREVKKRERESLHNQIKALKTVEEKLIAVNMPKYYGWSSLHLVEGDIKYDTASLILYLTRTHFTRVKELPLNNENPGISDDMFNKIKQEVKEALIFEHRCRRRKHEFEFESDLQPHELDKIITSSVIQQINRILMTNLSSVSQHLLTSQVDYEPRLEAFWFVGGMEPTMQQRKSRKSLSWMTEEDIEEPTDRPVQYFGCPVLQLRHELPLCPVSDQMEQPEASASIKHFRIEPTTLGYRYEKRNGTNIPGFWPGDESEFGLISFHTLSNLFERRDKYGTEDEKDAIDSQAILASYGWLLPQACYKGFSTYNDITYPFITQTVFTNNGQHWSFYIYQLNTILVHSDYAVNNPRCNLCWGTEQMALYDNIEDNEIIGFNDDLLKMLISLYTNEPKEREGVELRPYLESGKPWVAHIEETDRREWLEKTFKHMYSCRPRHRLPYEVYNWERIYKIDHNTRPMDPRRRPFELGTNPNNSRRYDEHFPEYLPKALRPENDKKTKWKKTYYPLSKNYYRKDLYK